LPLKKCHKNKSNFGQLLGDCIILPLQTWHKPWPKPIAGIADRIPIPLNGLWHRWDISREPGSSSNNVYQS